MFTMVIGKHTVSLTQSSACLTSICAAFFILKPEASSEKIQVVVDRSPRKVFIDLGANRGDSIEIFLGIYKRDTSLFGLGSSGDWEIYGFEANPYFNTALTKLADRIRSERLAKAVHMFNSTAVWTNDGTVTFYLDTVNLGENPDYYAVGSSLLSDHKDVGNGTKVTVPCKDINKLLKQFSPPDEVFLKMDVEGAEIDLLSSMFLEGTMPIVTRMFVEWHPWIPSVKQHLSTIQKIVEPKLAGWF